MRILTALAFLLYTYLLPAQQIAITLDDAPFGYSAGLSDARKIEAFEEILDALKKYKVKATFMVTSGNISDSTKVLLKKALEAGHQLGNHTHRHFDLNEVSANTYIADIDSCKQLANEWINSDYFRFAKLHRGDTRPKRDSVAAYLQAQGLKIAPVTIDNNEWVYNRGYSLALKIGNTEVMERIAKEYIYHMKEVTSRYQKLSLQLTEREIPQILLLHANPINAKHLVDLLHYYKKEGWEFITLDEAMRDTFYLLEDDYVGPYGFSQLDRIKRSTSKN